MSFVTLLCVKSRFCGITEIPSYVTVVSYNMHVTQYSTFMLLLLTDYKASIDRNKSMSIKV